MPSVRALRRSFLLLATLAVANAAQAQKMTLAVGAGLTLPMGGAGPREDVPYKDLYKPGLGARVELRRLIGPHLAVAVDLGINSQPVDEEKFGELLNAGTLKVSGGGITRTRFGLGVAWETNTTGGPNTVFKFQPGLYLSSPDSVTVTSPDLGLISVTELDSVSDFGLNLGALVEMPIKPGVALFAGAETDLIFGSDLFSADSTTTLVHLTALLGVSLWF